MSGTAGRESDGNPCGSVPTTSTPRPSSPRTELSAIAPNSTTSPAGIRLSSRGSRNSAASAPAPTRNVVQSALGKLPDDAQELLDGVAVRLVHAEQLVELADGHEHREAHHEPVHHGLRQELRDEAQPDDARQQEHEARDQHEGGRVRGVGLGVGGVRRGRRDQGRGHRRGEQRRRRRGAPDHQVARRAQHGVDEQRRHQRVEARLRRQARDARIGHRLGDDEPPQRQAGDDVQGQPGAVVAGQPCQDRDEAPDRHRWPPFTSALMVDRCTRSGAV